MKKRINKSKKEVVQDIKLVQETDRKRDLIRKVVFPFLIELNDTIGFCKVFLQSCSMGVETAFTETSKTAKVSQFIPRLTDVFGQSTASEEEKMKYIKFLELMKDESVTDFVSLIETIPRAIDQYRTGLADKQGILDLPIDDILG